MSTVAQLRLRDDPLKRVVLQSAHPLTIGRATNNRLALPSQQAVSDHHAVVRFSKGHGWVVCDWKSRDGTYLEGEQIRRCRPLHAGDEIRLGKRGPVLVFLVDSPSQEQPAGALPSVRGGPGCVDIGGEEVRFRQIHSATVRSEPHHPHIFSWWLLLSLAGLMLLPFPLLFWPLELAALGLWLLLGSRRSHTLLVVLKDGRALRRSFDNRATALAHRNGIRRAISQSDGPPGKPS
ncbi:MAG: FHA domain-containing protein [Cyanobacteriota bacterium]|nr:FHA domain-containing protein [Cyanobacteriota bacterium]